MSDVKQYKVIDGPVGIRAEPDGAATGARLGQGEEVGVISEPVEKGAYVWVQHDKGWSAAQNTDGDQVFMLDISNIPADQPRAFRVWAQMISVRDTPNGKRLPAKLYRGAQVMAEPGTRTVAANYVWWKHEQGWSAECSVNGKEIFMKEVFDMPAKAVPADKRVELPNHLKGKVHLQVAQGAKVRAQPSTDPRGMIIITLKRGKLVEADMDTAVEADGYYWVKHELGWSAMMSVDGKTVFLAEPGTIPGLIYVGPDGPRAEDLPGYRSLISKMPVDEKDIQWFQYYGNNIWAYLHGKAYGYDRYSQGLHGGLDFGNSLRAGVPVYAGIEAEYFKTEYPSKNNSRILLKNGDYTFIYQHITNIRGFSPGQKITPDTQVGVIEHNSVNGGWDHLHFEVRYAEEWIINPLVLLTQELYDKIIARFNPDKPNVDVKKIDSVSNFFYKSAKWKKWTTPLDQPMIKLGGPCVGPRFQTDVDYDSD